VSKHPFVIVDSDCDFHQTGQGGFLSFFTPINLQVKELFQKFDQEIKADLRSRQGNSLNDINP
jgi:hypothetical protein